MYLLDTYVVEAMRRFGGKSSDPVLEAWALTIPASQMYLSTATLIELDGAINQLKLEALEQTDPQLADLKSEQASILRTWLLERLGPSFENRVLPIDHQVAQQMVGLNDTLSDKGTYTVIAATALVHRLVIVTRHPERYTFVGVSIVNPWRAVDHPEHERLIQEGLDDAERGALIPLETVVAKWRDRAKGNT
jgi:predicted nucleic acid-binding protein